MSPRFRKWLFLVSTLGLALLLFWAVVALPGFGNYPGPYGDLLNSVLALRYRLEHGHGG